MKILTAVVLATACALAHASIIGVVDSVDGDRLEFHDSAGACVGEALHVEYIRADQRKVPGCYVVRNGAAQIVFFDGDVGVVPVAAIRRPKAA